MRGGIDTHLHIKMTYRTSDGRQHVVTATGNGDNAVVRAFSLPR